MTTTQQTKYNRQTLAQAIDHTKLAFSANEDQEVAIIKLCHEAIENNFFAVCVRPEHVKLAKETLGTNDIKVATVIGFPKEKLALDSESITPSVGHFTTEEKVAETRKTVSDGVDELDLVLNVAAFKKEAYDEALPVTMAELQAIKEASEGVPIKVIIETDLLSEEEIKKATMACAKTGMYMVKTSTGMLIGGKGATAEAVSLIRKTLDQHGPDLKIKASGGIKNTEHAIMFMELGANRLGTSSGADIVSGISQ